MQYTAKYQSPIGAVTLASDGGSLTGLWFDGQKYFAATLEPEHMEKALPVFHQTRRWLDRYFRGVDPGPIPPLSLQGSPFRRAVWEIMLKIPYGQVTTYGEIAAQIAKDQGRSTRYAQAVGNAVGHNPISVIVPCHRVIGSDGSLTGYAGGISKKIFLLSLEKADASKFHIPKRETAL